MATGRGTKRQTEPDAELADVSSGSLSSGRPSRNAKRRRSKHLLSRIGEDDDDEDEEWGEKRGVSYYIEWVTEGNRKEAANSRQSTKAFIEETRKQEQQLRAFLDSQEQMLRESTQRFVSSVGSAYSAVVSPAPAVLSSSQSSQGGQALIPQIQQLLDTSRSLLDRYTSTGNESELHRLELPTATWKRDKQDIKELLACGREHGERLVESHLLPDSCSPPEHDKSNTGSGHEQAASGLFPESRKALAKDSWGRMAAEQFECFKVLTGT